MGLIKFEKKILNPTGIQEVKMKASHKKISDQELKNDKALLI